MSFETVTVVTPRRVRLMCSHCPKGEMIPTGRTLLMSPPIYPHECTDCGHMEKHKRCYPFIEYVDANEEMD